MNRRFIQKMQRQDLLCNPGTCWDYPDMVQGQSWRDYRGRERKRFDKRHLDYRSLIKRRFKPAQIQVRCINRMHKITLTQKGKLVLHDHPDLKAELMLGFMAQDCRCLTVYKQWQAKDVQSLPDGLRKQARGMAVTHRAIKRTGVPDAPHYPSIVDWMREDFNPWNYVPKSSFIKKAFKRAIRDCLRQIGAADDLMATRARDGGTGDFKIDTNNLCIYRDLCVTDEQRRKVREYQKPSLQVFCNNNKLMITGDMHLSWLSLYRQGKVIEDGKLFCGVDEHGKRYYLKRMKDDYWYQGAWHAEADKA